MANPLPAPCSRCGLLHRGACRPPRLGLRRISMPTKHAYHVHHRGHHQLLQVRFWLAERASASYFTNSDTLCNGPRSTCTFTVFLFALLGLLALPPCKERFVVYLWPHSDGSTRWRRARPCGAMWTHVTVFGCPCDRDHLVFEAVNGWRPTVPSFAHGTNRVLTVPIDGERRRCVTPTLFCLPVIITARWPNACNPMRCLAPDKKGACT